jgi:hypothetical protein
MPLDELDPVALEALLLAHATLAKLESKGLLSRAEIQRIVESVGFALKVVDLHDHPKRKAALAVLKHLIGPAGGAPNN